jgi:hypothetical protein
LSKSAFAQNPDGPNYGSGMTVETVVELVIDRRKKEGSNPA